MPFYGPSLPHSAALSDLLAPGLAAKPDEIALISGNRRWTWRELQRDIDALASGLTTLGLNRGDRIASLMPNQGELLLFYLACHKAGLIVTPLNYRYTPPEIDYALGLSGAAALCVGAERSADVEASALARTLPKGLICFGGPIGDAPRFEDLVASGTPTADLPTPDINDPALIFFTSGSTGKPKGVTHSYSSFGCMAASFAGALDLSQDDIVLPGGSIAHIGSLSTAFAAFFAGATVVIPHSFDAATILSALRQHRPTILLMIPAAFVAMERDPDTTHEDFSSLRICVTGGDKFPANVAKEFADKTGVLIQETYGLTEGADCLFNQS
ncbi:MAG: AMP-binding protein, partial [Pseudomonadota bacterium]